MATGARNVLTDDIAKELNRVEQRYLLGKLGHEPNWDDYVLALHGMLEQDVRRIRRERGLA